MGPADTILYRGWYLNTTWGTLDQDQRYHNGMRFAQLLYNYGWTEESIAGIIGNVDAESGLSPATAESNHYPDYIPSNEEVIEDVGWWGGLGFVQWTPGRINLAEWAEQENILWYDGRTQAKRLKYECDNNLEMPDAWDFYTHTHDPPDDCARFFCLRYLRPADPEGTMRARQRKALEWYGNIHGKLLSPLKRLMLYKNNRERKELKPRCLWM